jgi:hypothetical protein
LVTVGAPACLAGVAGLGRCHEVSGWWRADRADQHTLTAEDPLPPELRDALALIK